MLEILPLVFLLVGMISVPSTFGRLIQNALRWTLLRYLTSYCTLRLGH
jgi:hypothetical protein